MSSISPPRNRSVLITGANGYLGSAVARAFSRGGWHTYGLIRRASSAPALCASEITPIVGSSAAPADVLAALEKHTKSFDVIVGTTEQLPCYRTHHEDNVRLFRMLAKKSGDNGVRPLLIFTSGCKDYGRTGVHGSGGLAPHTEESRLDPPPFARARAAASEEILVENLDVLDAVCTRPTLLCGHGGSFSGVFFEMAEKAAAAEKNGNGTGLYIGVDKNTIYHACHVDDVGDAYVRVAESDRDIVKGKVYNISAWKYETLEEVITSLVKEYDIQGGVTWRQDESWELASLLDYSQWVDSGRIRSELGWHDRRLLFSSGLGVYRRSYEAAKYGGDEGIARMKDKTGIDYGSSK
ncbi:MAG: hypothetical protein MMC23_005483 [Stictis urceolatum]|nr:hypothetical protein [Stictis urceolata]